MFIKQVFKSSIYVKVLNLLFELLFNFENYGLIKGHFNRISSLHSWFHLWQQASHTNRFFNEFGVWRSGLHIDNIPVLLIVKNKSILCTHVKPKSAARSELNFLLTNSPILSFIQALRSALDPLSQPGYSGGSSIATKATGTSSGISSTMTCSTLISSC